MFNLFRTKFYVDRDSGLQPHTLLSWFRCPNFTTVVDCTKDWRFLVEANLSLNCVSYCSKPQLVNALAFIHARNASFGVGIPAELANTIENPKSQIPNRITHSHLQEKFILCLGLVS